jgi:hypothetical protein
VFPGSRFVVGANLPWIRYGCDFGANAWHPRGGVADGPMTRETRDVLSRLASDGISTVRWFLFCDGRAGIRFDAEGEARGLDDHVLPDLDAALALASHAGIGLIFTLSISPGAVHGRTPEASTSAAIAGSSASRRPARGCSTPSSRRCSNATAVILQSAPGTSSTSQSGSRSAAAPSIHARRFGRRGCARALPISSNWRTRSPRSP